MKVGVKTRDAVKLIKGSLAALRKVFQLCLGQIAVSQLYGSQFVKNHFGLSREPAPLLANRLWRRMGLRYFRTLAPVSLLNFSTRCLFAQSPVNSGPFR